MLHEQLLLVENCFDRWGWPDATRDDNDDVRDENDARSGRERPPERRQAEWPCTCSEHSYDP